MNVFLLLFLDHPNPIESKKVLNEDTSTVLSVFVENYNVLDSAVRQKGELFDQFFPFVVP